MNTDNLSKDIYINGKQIKLAVPFISAAIFNWTDKEYLNSGIYIFRCRAEAKEKGFRYYVGQAKHLGERIRAHLRYHTDPSKDSRALHLALLKYYDKDPTTFDVGILEYTDLDSLNDKEIHWIDTLDTYRNQKDYNLTPGGEAGPNPSKVTEEIYNIVYDELINTNKDQKIIAQENGISEERVSTINNDETYFWNRKLHPDAAYPLRLEDIGNKNRLANIRANSDNKIYNADIIVCYNPENNEIVRRFETDNNSIAIIQAADWILLQGLDKNRKYAINGISGVINGEHHTYKGFGWEVL